jgi:hypothetical protein
MQYALSCYQNSSCHSQATNLGLSLLKQQKLDKVGLRPKLNHVLKNKKECFWVASKRKNTVTLTNPIKFERHKIQMKLSGKLSNE